MGTVYRRRIGHVVHKPTGPPDKDQTVAQVTQMQKVTTEQAADQPEHYVHGTTDTA